MAARERVQCRFAAQRLVPRLRAFTREIDGVREGSNPEHVHSMRVASRRLRSALPLFAPCFLEKKYRCWMKGIKAITGALGNARDTDVQIMFLSSYAEKHPPIFKGNHGVSSLIELLHKQRERQQADVLAALTLLENGNTAEEITAALHEFTKTKKMGNDEPELPAELYRAAAGNIGLVLDGMLSHDGAIHNPDDTEGHHTARIATKKLRYTMEVYRPLYPNRLKSALKHIKKLQESLGTLHDCDVWAQFLAGVVAQQPQELSGQDTSRAPANGLEGPPLEPDVIQLLLDRKNERDTIYRELRASWEDCKSHNVWERLHNEISVAAETSKVIELPVQKNGAKRSKERSLDPVHALAGSFPEGQEHAHQVTRLALMLFDELAGLHHYSGEERFYLECAGLLHDIGWAFGQKGHHTRSFSMIHEDRTLPLSDRERSIVALIARFHRKPVPGSKDAVFASLRPKDKKIVCTCAALLRVADGLDYPHTNRVQSLACTISVAEVTCRLEHDGDVSVEKARAIQKADLFSRVFSRTMVIE
ncbi:MAG: CHAD domain-containing protein [Methanoregula sp.]|nr:CHAD domain-containing protein [Methanoregula sp.]